MSEIKHLDLGSGPTTDYQPATTPVSTDFNYQSPQSSTGKSMPRSRSNAPMIILVVAIFAGILTGVGAQRLTAKTGLPGGIGGPEPVAQHATGTVKVGDVFGSADEKTFKDSAEGYLEKNTSDISEGTHRLVRPGGESQTVYMISSITDLDTFDGMQVKVWGETFKGQKAGWLMDVGRIQVLATQATPPTEE